MTCTDGGEDNSPVHDTYHEDQVTLGADLLVFGRESLFETKYSVWACLFYLASGLLRMCTREPTALLCVTYGRG